MYIKCITRDTHSNLNLNINLTSFHVTTVKRAHIGNIAPRFYMENIKIRNSECVNRAKVLGM